MRALRVWLGIAALCSIGFGALSHAHAQAEPEASAEAEAGSESECEATDPECRCEGNWGCWRLLLRTKGTLLGLKGSMSQVQGSDDSLDGALLTTYMTEHYGTRGTLSGHFAASGAIGGGSAGTEGGTSVALDFGYRLPVSATSGPFLRAGVSGFYLGHARLKLASFEPLSARLGYQVLDGPRLLEWAVTGGATLRGSFDAGADAERPFDPSPQFGGYFALWLGPVRASGSFTRILTQHGGESAPVTLWRGSVCGYVESIAICGELTAAYGATLDPPGTLRAARVFYSGLVLGLSP